VKEALQEVGLQALPSQKPRVRPSEKVHGIVSRREYVVDFLPKVKSRLFWATKSVEAAIEAIRKAAQTAVSVTERYYVFQYREVVAFVPVNPASTQSDPAIQLLAHHRRQPSLSSSLNKEN